MQLCHEPPNSLDLVQRRFERQRSQAEDGDPNAAPAMSNKRPDTVGEVGAGWLSIVEAAVLEPAGQLLTPTRTSLFGAFTASP